MECPAASCKKSFKRLEHLHRHIRDEKDESHKFLAVLINETQCSNCLKNCRRPSDLVKHERHTHGEVYRSRLDKLLGTSQPSIPTSDLIPQDSTSTSQSSDQSFCAVRSDSALLNGQNILTSNPEVWDSFYDSAHQVGSVWNEHWDGFFVNQASPLYEAQSYYWDNFYGCNSICTEQ